MNDVGRSGGAERGVESVARALDLLDALADREYGLVELGRVTGLKPSTTHRLLSTLIKHGYVRRNVDTGDYALGLRPLRLASGLARDTEELLTVVRPFLARIHRVTRETTNLFLGQGLSVVLIQQLLHDDDTNLATRPGVHLPFHATAAGKAISAYTEPQIIADVLSNAQFHRHTQRTICGPQELMQEFTEIRRRGFAVSVGELRNGMTCNASPVFDQHSRVIGAIGVTHMENGFTCGASTAELGELVAMTAHDASRALGFVGEWNSALIGSEVPIAPDDSPAAAGGNHRAEPSAAPRSQRVASASFRRVETVVGRASHCLG